MTFLLVSHNILMALSWLANVFLTTFSCFFHDFPLTFSWPSHDFSWLSHDFLMIFSWLSVEFLMTFSWVSQDFLMKFSWHSHDFLRTFPGFSYVFLVILFYFIKIFKYLNRPWFVPYRPLLLKGVRKRPITKLRTQQYKGFYY